MLLSCAGKAAAVYARSAALLSNQADKTLYWLKVYTMLGNPVMSCTLISVDNLEITFSIKSSESMTLMRMLF